MAETRSFENQLEEYETQLRNTIEKGGKPSVDLCVKIIKLINDTPLRRPDLIVKCGREILFESKVSLGDSVWEIYEQVLKAALDTNHIDLATSCLEILQNKFGNGLRVRRLEGLLLEGQGQFELALANYNDILEEDPIDQISLKRRVAVHKGMGNIADAIKSLNQYLEIYMADADAYAELADLYLSITDYKKAVFCVEELILHNPYNYLYHLKYADIKYSMEDYVTARSYYAQSLKLKKENNARALYGLLMSTNAISSSKDKAMNTKLMELAEKELIKLYLERNKDMVPILKNMFGLI